MHVLAEKILTMPLVAKLLFALNLGALGFALTMQFGFDVQPCILCLWQRVPYGVAAAATLTLALRKPAQRYAVWILAFCVVTYLTGMGLAVFHSGVERHLWEGTTGCAIQPIHGTTAEDLRQSLLQTITPRCDVIAWSLFGITLTNMNVLLSLALAFFTTAATVKTAQDK